jgi:hypothetical protein
LLLPMYWILELVPSTRMSAKRLGLVTSDQMIAALARSVEHPAEGFRVLEVPEIRATGQLAAR